MSAAREVARWARQVREGYVALPGLIIMTSSFHKGEVGGVFRLGVSAALYDQDDPTSARRHLQSV